MRVRVAGFALTAILIVSSFSLVMTILPENVRASTLYVGGSGPGNYTKIQDAIDNASSGETIYVYNGTYYENIVVDKSLSLVGEDRNTTMIDGNGIGTVIYSMTANWLNITEFTITNSGSGLFDAGMKIYSSQRGYIANNNILNNKEGIFLASSSHVTIANNTVSLSDGMGIELNVCTHIVITNNSVLSNGAHGVWPNFSDNIVVMDNDLSWNSNHGLYIGTGDNFTVSGNRALHNNNGISLDGTKNVTIADNDISSNRYNGLTLSSSRNATIARNNVSSNEHYGIYLWSSTTSILVFHNNLIGNGAQAADNAGNENSWDDGYPSGGNYWSNYPGVDNCSGPDQDICPDSDGIGDTPRVLDADSQDQYPLMFPYGLQAPKPPTILYTNLTGESMENVTLIWALSPDDGMGYRSIVGYGIYRNSTYNPEGLGYELIALVPNGTSEFVDVSAGEGNPDIYFYRVCALDMKNDSKCAENQAGKFTRPLLEGPNLISIPLIQSNESTEIVLQTIEFDKAWSYDSSEAKWKWYMTFKPYKGELGTINRKMGLWVNATSECNLTVAGIVPTSTSNHLSSGWNLLGFPSFNSTYTISHLKAVVSSTRVEGFDPSAPPYFLRALADGDILRTGFGYWVSVVSETSWTIGNS